MTQLQKRDILGALLWVSCLQYFVMQVAVAAAFIGGFSLAHNPISDLGNTVCGMFGDRYVCSPLNAWMNWSFVVLGLAQAVGAVLLFWHRRQHLIAKIGAVCFVLAGIGTIIVAIFPENSIEFAHAAGAALPFLLGNVAMIVLSYFRQIPRALRLYGLVSGLVGLGALVLFMTHTYLGIGHGGMERVVAYPQTFWMIAHGVYVLRALYRKKPTRSTQKS